MHTGGDAVDGARTGDELDETLEAHEARSAVRWLAVACFDAWDRGARDELAALLPADGSAAPFLDAWTLQRLTESWSLHFLGNEEIHVAPDATTATGSWLWWAALVGEPGRSSSWAGGDVTLQAVSTADGWRIRSVARTDRYRFDVAVGWHSGPPVSTDRSGEVGRQLPAVPSHPAVAPTPPATGDPDARWHRLVAESDIRNLIAHHVTSSSGPGAVAHIHLLASVGIDLDEPGRTAGVHWRDLYAVDEAGTARWWAHQNEATAHLAAGAWTLGPVARTRLVDVEYGAGWPSTRRSVEGAR